MIFNFYQISGFLFQERLSNERDFLISMAAGHFHLPQLSTTVWTYNSFLVHLQVFERITDLHSFNKQKTCPRRSLSNLSRKPTPEINFFCFERTSLPVWSHCNQGHFSHDFLFKKLHQYLA